MRNKLLSVLYRLNMNPNDQENLQWLKNQCNRYKNGTCMTLKCMKRGGYVRGSDMKVDYEIATCNAFEIVKRLEQTID